MNVYVYVCIMCVCERERERERSIKHDVIKITHAMVKLSDLGS